MVRVDNQGNEKVTSRNGKDSNKTGPQSTKCDRKGPPAGKKKGPQGKKLTKKAGQGRKATKTTVPPSQTSKDGKTEPTSPPTSTTLEAETTKQKNDEKNANIERKDENKGKKEGNTVEKEEVQCKDEVVHASLQGNVEKVKDEKNEVIGVNGTIEELPLVSSFECVECCVSEATSAATADQIQENVKEMLIENFEIQFVTLTVQEHPIDKVPHDAEKASENTSENSDNIKKSESKIEDIAKENTMEVQKSMEIAKQISNDKRVKAPEDSVSVTTTNIKEDVAKVNESQPLSSVPLRMRKTMQRKDRNARCLSVGAPMTLSKSSKADWRVSMFELSTDGWVVDRIRDGHKSASTKTLNLDQDINDILKSNSAAVVSLGNIKLQF